MELYIPEELHPFEDDLKFFFDLMIRKLHTNRHKGFGHAAPLPQLWEGLRGETNELFNAALRESQFNVALEAADVANFAFLFANKSLNQDKAHFEQQQHEFGAAANAASRNGTGEVGVARHPNRDGLAATITGEEPPKGKFGQ